MCVCVDRHGVCVDRYAVCVLIGLVCVDRYAVCVLMCGFQPRPQSVPYKEALGNRRVLTSSTESREGLTQQV